MKSLPVNKVDTVEEFVFALASYAVSVESLYKLAQRAIKSNYLEPDEREQAETIMHEARRVFHTIDGLVHIMGDRANIDANKVAHQLAHKLKVKESSNGVDTSTDDSRGEPRAFSVGNASGKIGLPAP